jgi:hypothetical protein
MELVTVHNVVQFSLAILGIITAVLTARKNKYWVITSLLSQPLWFYSAYTAEQWGMVTLCAVYTSSTLYAIKFWWFTKKTVHVPRPKKRRKLTEKW